MKLQEHKLRHFKIYQTIANVLFIGVLVFGSLGILVAVTGETALAASGVDLSDLITRFFEQHFAEMEEIVLPSNAAIHSIISSIIAQAALGLALTCFLFKALANLFKNIVATETPFHPKSIRILKSIGYAFFIYTAVHFVIQLISSAVVTQGMMVDSSFATASIKFSTIVYGFIILALAEIFEYGASLQRDSESIV